MSDGESEVVSENSDVVNNSEGGLGGSLVPELSE